VCASATGAPAQTALLWINDSGSGFGHARTAAASAGFAITEVFDEISFQVELAKGPGVYDIAIYDNACCFADGGLAGAIDAFTGAGGKVHFAYWNLDSDPALQASMDVASTVDTFTAFDIHDNAGHPSWAGAASPVLVDGSIPDPWNDNGDELTPNLDGETVSTHIDPAGPGATVVGEGAGGAGVTLCNGFEYDTKTADQVQALLQSQMQWVEVGMVAPNALVLDWSTNDHVGADATVAAGLNPLITVDGASLEAALPTMPWRMVTIDNPSNGFAASTSDAIADYIDGGGRVHMSYWNLDADPVLQAAFGVSATVDFFDPRPVFAEAAPHPSWGALTQVPVDPAPSPWNDNGDELSVDAICVAGAPEVIGVFDSAGSIVGAIVTAGGRTLVNGFDYDSMQTGAMLDVATSQIRWLRTAEPGGGPPRPFCYPDCDQSGELDFFDFLCFQNAYAAGDCYADCDESTSIDFMDFMCFQNEFAAFVAAGGCPELELIQLGVEAPPSVICGETMESVVDPRPTFSDVTTVPTSIGDITFDIPCSHRVIGGGWGTWSHGYTGSVYYTNGSPIVNVGAPAGNTAFYLYAEPNPFALIEFEITGSLGSETRSVVETIDGSSGAAGYAFCGGVENVEVRTTDGVTDFAVGEFGVAN
ncbi:MAG: hypothetical protein ACF8R7_18625, partial [Phycisphaerales bacterium JB039]